MSRPPKFPIPASSKSAASAPDNEFIGDGIFDEETGAPAKFTIVDTLDSTRRKHLASGTAFEDLLVPIFQRGSSRYQPPTLGEVRARAQNQIAMFHPGVKRFVNPHGYPVGLEQRLHERKVKLVLQARGRTEP